MVYIHKVDNIYIQHVYTHTLYVYIILLYYPFYELGN